MWHEARKQEKKIRGMLVDYKKRAERRREYYEKIKQDPTQFIQIHGRACKIHLDPAVHFAAEAPGSMMPWRGDRESMIDRFDVRAHLDDIPYYNPRLPVPHDPEELWEERQANYERYRILVQNEFLGIKEEKFLNQIHTEELYGPVGSRATEEEKKALMPKKAAISFIYDDPCGGGKYSSSSHSWNQPPPPSEDDDSAEDSDSDMDLDLTVDVFQLTNQQQAGLNDSGVEYGMSKDDFMALLNRDLEEAESLRVAKEHEDEKAMYSGRKSRKERRALKKKHLDKKASPPSYAARDSPTYDPYHRFSSHSKSQSMSPPSATSQIKFITSFGNDSEGGGSDDEGAGVIIIPESDKGPRKEPSRHKGGHHCRTSSSSRERSRSRGSTSHRHHSSRSSSRHRSRTRSPKRRKEESRYKSRRSRSYSRSRRSSSRSSNRVRRSKYYSRSSRSRSYSASRSRSKSRSHSRSRGQGRMESRRKSSPKNGRLSVSQDSRGPSSRKLPSPPRRRYYGRRAERSDSESGLEDDNGGALGAHLPPKSSSQKGPSSVSLSITASLGNETTSDKGSKLNAKERLRKKMQALLKKQYKLDKRLEKEKAEKAEQERQDREEELREIAIKLRRRERERRHRYHDDDSASDDSSDSRSRSSSRSPPPKVRNRRDRSPEPADSEPKEREKKEGSCERGEEKERSRERLDDEHREPSWERDLSKRRERDDRWTSRDESDRGREMSYSDRESSKHYSSRESSRHYHDSPHRYSREDSNGETDTSDEEGAKIRLVDY